MSVYRRLLTAFFILAIASAMLKAAEIPVDLPATLSLYASGGKTEVIGSGRALFVSTNEGETFVKIGMPPTLNNEFPYAIVQGIQVSADGKYLFVRVYTANGLYRYEIESRSWRTILPPDASTVVSVLVTDKKGGIYVGCGGSSTDPSDARGLFVSHDAGDTWDQVVVDVENKDKPTGINLLSISPSGNMLVSYVVHGVGVGTKRTYLAYKPSDSEIFNRSVFSVYDLTSTDKNKYLYDGDVLFVHTGSDLNQGKIKPLVYNLTVKRMEPWQNDSVFVHAYDRESKRDTFMLLIDSTVIGLKVGTVESISRPVVGVRSNNNSSLYWFGSGRNVFMDLSDYTLTPIVPPEPVYSLGQQAFSCDSFCVVQVGNHGWYRVFPNGTSELMNRSDQEAMSNGYFDQVEVRGSNILVISRNSRNILRIGKNRVDTLLKLPSSIPASSLCVSGENKIYVSTGGAIVHFDLLSQKADTIPLAGWPSYDNLGDLLPLGISAAFVMDSKLFAWASGNYFPVDHWKAGGLFSFENDVWSRADGGMFDSRSSYRLGKYNNSKLIIAAVEQSAGAQVSNVTVGEYSVLSGNMSNVGSDEAVSPYISTMAVTDWCASWNTLYNRLWVNDGKLNQIDKYGSVYQVASVGDKLLVNTEKNGVLLLSKNDIVSSVEDDGVIAIPTSSVFTIPHPVNQHNECKVLVHGCNNVHSSFEIHSVEGSILLSDSFTHSSETGDSSAMLLPSISHTGLVQIVIFGAQCSHHGSLIVY